jgi:hypothetical protein
MERAYGALASTLRAAQPLVRAIGPQRVEKPLARVERAMKGLLFDCRMCGSCALSVNGMACPMNCPKQVRNGPCGGVRADGTCEANAGMPCVGLDGWRGACRNEGGRCRARRRPHRARSRGALDGLPLVMGGAPAPCPRSTPLQPSDSARERCRARRLRRHARPGFRRPVRRSAEVLARLDRFVEAWTRST